MKTRLVNLTTSFEGGWQAVAGNGDGQVMSLGPIQHNYGQGTLQPIMKGLARTHPEVIRDTCGQGFLDACLLDGGKGFVQANMLRGTLVTVDWRTRLRALLGTPEARAAFTDGSQVYFDNAVRLAQALGIRTERGLALCFDVAVQSGAVRRDHVALFTQRGGFKPQPEWAKLKILAYVVADCANPTYRNDVLGRKLSIALGGTEQSGMSPHGLHFDVEKDYGLSYDRTF